MDVLLMENMASTTQECNKTLDMCWSKTVKCLLLILFSFLNFSVCVYCLVLCNRHRLSGSGHSTTCARLLQAIKPHPVVVQSHVLSP